MLRPFDFGQKWWRFLWTLSLKNIRNKNNQPHWRKSYDQGYSEECHCGNEWRNHQKMAKGWRKINLRRSWWVCLEFVKQCDWKHTKLKLNLDPNWKGN